MLKKTASIVLASFRGSTYRSVRLASSLAAALPAEWRVLERRDWAGKKLVCLSILRLLRHEFHVKGFNDALCVSHVFL
jgi:hypothetical protein